MIFAIRLERQLKKRLAGRVTFMKDWRKQRTVRWQGKNHLPVALMLHHTAGAATDSTNPSHPGNRPGANQGIINYIQNNFRVPAANFTLDRDGTVYVHSAYPVWHAGVGSFKGKSPWSIFGIPDNAANNWVLGVEIVSKGRKKDFTRAQIRSLRLLQQSCGIAASWPKGKRLATVRHPRHRDWTTRKIDILYSQDEVNAWMVP
jgi:hypothetical protein